jgi:hypothetical protein
VILLYREDEFGGRFDATDEFEFMRAAGEGDAVEVDDAVRLVVHRRDEGAARRQSRALSPRALRDHLLRDGAEVVHMPGSERSIHVEPVHP